MKSTFYAIRGIQGECELIERYEEDYSELPPKLKPYGKKPWYARLDEKGQVTDLREILALSGED